MEKYSDKIDIFTHISPPKYDDLLYKHAKNTVHKAGNARTPALVDLEERFRIMDKSGSPRQVLTIVHGLIAQMDDFLSQDDKLFSRFNLPLVV